MALYFAGTNATGDGLFKVNADGSVDKVSDVSFFGGRNVGGEYFFSGSTAATGRELYAIFPDGHVDLVSDIRPGMPSSAPASLFSFAGKLYFNTSVGQKVTTPGGSVDDANFGVTPLTGLASYNGEMYFLANDGVSGREIWKLKADGTVQQVSDYVPGTGSAFAGFSYTSLGAVFRFVEGKLYFDAQPPGYGLEFLRLNADGTLSIASNVNTLGDSIARQPLPSTTIGISALGIFNDEEYFSLTGDNAVPDVSLWKMRADGGFVKVPDTGGLTGFRVVSPTLNGEAYFAANGNLWKIKADGTTEAVSGGSHVSAVAYVAFNGALYFHNASPTGASDAGLWRINRDGTLTHLGTLNGAVDEATLLASVVYNGELYFSAYSASTGWEPWKIRADGSFAMVADLNPGPDDGLPNVNFAPSVVFEPGTVQPPMIISEGAADAATISVRENVKLVETVSALAFDRDQIHNLTYSIAGGSDQSLFRIDPDTGSLFFLTAPDFEAPADSDGNNSYVVTVRASDGVMFDEQTLTINVSDIDESTNFAPVITSNGGGATALIGLSEKTNWPATVNATDANPGTTIAYSITGGADAAKFNINPASGILTFIDTPSASAPTDADHDNVYVVDVRASDGSLSDDQEITVVIQALPVITSDGGAFNPTIQLPTGSTFITHLTAIDANFNESLSWHRQNFGTAINFGTSITNITTTQTAHGTMTEADLVFNSAPVAGTYTVSVDVSDQFAQADVQTLTIIISDGGTIEHQPTITSDGGLATATLSVAENTSAVTTVVATDPEAGTTLTYSISGGADQDKFQISGGALSFVTAPDFEAPTDSDHNNSYIVTVRASDGTMFDEQTITVNVTDVSDGGGNQPPVITSNGGGATAAVSVAENATTVTTVTATDPNGDPLTFSIVGGADQGGFQFNGNALSFATAPDFEAPTDSDHNGSYVITVRASDGSLFDDQTITVNVTDVTEGPGNQAPTITSDGGGDAASASVAENTTAVTTVAATDPDAGTTLGYSIIGGADAARFQINAASGVLSFIAAPDFEAPTDADHNNSYNVQVRASDGSLFDDQTLTVTVTDVHEPQVNLTGTSDDDSFTALSGNERIDALGGIDTITFNFRLVDATVSYVGNTVIIDGPSSHTVLTGFETYVFTDGTVNNNDGDWLVDDLFYYARNHDVWNAHAGADAHYHATGWHEGRNPDAFFSTKIYLSANPDVQAAAVDPLIHFDQHGWHEGRVPSLAFDPRQYLDANPDVVAANLNPLAHFLQHGAAEGRQPFAPSELIAASGFDYVYYLQNNPDVAAANIDPLAHFQNHGWHEGRNPNALFDTNGYLANYPDVVAANLNPLEHYHQHGWIEGRDPSTGFDTTSYLGAYADVAAAHVNPLAHFLAFGIHEGRSPFGDGVWG